MIAVLTASALIGFGGYIFTSVALGKLFMKLHEHAWKGWVPIVNAITLFELGRYSALWVVGLFIPALNLVALVVLLLAVNNINRRLGCGGGFTLLAAVLFPVWAGVLGLGNRLDTGWLPAVAPTGYVPFGAVTALTMAPTNSAPTPSTPTPSTPTPSTPTPSTPTPSTPTPSTPTPSASAPSAPATSLPAAVDTSPTPEPHPAEPAQPAIPPQAIPAPEVVDTADTADPAQVQARPSVPPPFYVRATPVSPVVELPLAKSGDLAAAAADVARETSASIAARYTAEAARTVSPLPQTVNAHFDASDDDFDETMIVSRRMKPWTLETEHGLKVSLTRPIVLLGRNPARGSAHPDAQVVAIHDPDKTVSKTHARLDFFEGEWGIRDLLSTNGTVLIDSGGVENELDSGASARLTDRFLLGELAARIYLEG